MIVAGLATCYALFAGAAVAAAGEHDPFTGAVEVRRFSFETGEDRDYDDFPDGWTRRKGPGFPAYVPIGIDRGRGFDGERSLRFDLNGAQAVVYSPPIHIDSLHSYVFRGRIRTQGLRHDAAAVSVSFLNHKRERLERRMTVPVAGTHSGWVEVRIGPMAPPPAARFIVIGCHLLAGRRLAIHGAAWFDDLWLGRLPQLSIESRHGAHYVRPGEPVRIVARASGLEEGRSFRLSMRMEDDSGRLVAEEAFDFDPIIPNVAGPEESSAPVPEDSTSLTEWRIVPPEPGYYIVRAALQRDGVAILEKETAFAVMEFVEQNGRGEFGWSLVRDPESISPRELAEIAAQSGINWLKYPLWPPAAPDDPVAPVRTSELLELLAHRRIRAVGRLDAPPPEMRAKFARDWSGISEVFTLPPEFWKGALDPVIARYSSNVQNWQLGGDGDFSFVGLQRLPDAVQAVRAEFNRIGLDARIGVPWNWNEPLPVRDRLPRTFFALDAREPLSPDVLAHALRQSGGTNQPRWVTLRSPAPGGDGAAQLVRQMLAAKIGGAEAIVYTNVCDDELGLLRTDGAPGPLFLPWRTAALALQGAAPLGSLHLPNGSDNHVFARGGEVVIFLWADEPGEERLYAGQNATVADLWGRHAPATIDPGTGALVVPVGPVPRIVMSCPEPVVRWQLAVRFEQGRIESSTGEFPDAIVGVNPFPQGVSGEVRIKVPPQWQARPDRWSMQAAAGEEFRLPVYLALPPNATLGIEFATIEFDIVADRPCQFQVRRPYQVGLGDIGVAVADRLLEDGRLEIEQVITNQIEPPEVLDFRCSLFVPGQKRQTTVVTRLGRGQDRKLFYVPNGAALKGRELWIRAEQIGGNRVLNYRWRAGDGAGG